MSKSKFITAQYSSDASSSKHPKWGNRLYHLLMAIPMLFSCQSQSDQNQNINCNKHKKGEFSACIIKNFPVGSDYRSLDSYLEETSFIKARDPKDLAESRFYFIWRANNLANYSVVVVGQYDKDQKITHITVR